MSVIKEFLMKRNELDFVQFLIDGTTDKVVKKLQTKIRVFTIVILGWPMIFSTKQVPYEYRRHSDA